MHHSPHLNSPTPFLSYRPAKMFLSVITCLLLIPYCLCESHYSILGVSKNAKVKEIKKSYIKLAQKWHPDKNKGPDAEHMMSKINRAYEILSDEDKRRHYDLLEYEGDDAYTTTSDTTHGSSLGEINTREFMEDVLPASETTPYLIYFFHDFCEHCEDWNELLEDIIKDVQLLGIKMASVNVIVSNKVASHCNVYVHEVPQMVLIINRKPHPFKGSLSLDNVKQIVYDQLPSDSIKHVENATVNDILSMESRIKNNKPVVLFVSPQDTPSLNYKMAALQYQQYLVFYFLSSLPSDTSELENNMFNLTEGQEVLRIYSDSLGPTVTLEGNDLNKKNILNALGNHKWLSVPSVCSCTILDELCPVGSNARSCVLLVAGVNEKITDKFRTFALEMNRSNISMGTINPQQSSVLKSAISWDRTATDVTCDDSGIVARPVLIIRRLTNRKLEYSSLSGYCGTQAENMGVLKLLSHSKYTHSVIMATPCSFDRIQPTPTPNPNISAGQKLKVRLSEELSRLSTALQQLYNCSEKISSTTFICYGLLLIIPYLLLRYSRSAKTRRKMKELKWQELVCEIKEMKEGQEEIRRLVGENFGSLSKQVEDTSEKIAGALNDAQEQIKKQIEHECNSLKQIIKDTREKIGALNDAQEEIKEKQEEICDLFNTVILENDEEYDEAIDASVPQCNTSKEECVRRNGVFENYIKGHTWYTSQEFILLQTMIMRPEDVPGWNKYYEKYPLVYDWEWESHGSGKGDLVCTDGENKFLVVEIKSLNNSGNGSGKNHRNGKRMKKRRGEMQAKKFAKAWHYGNQPHVKKTTGILVTNEETQQFIELPSDEEDPNNVYMCDNEKHA